METKYSPPLFLGCDIGTSTTKTMIYDSEGRALGSSSMEYPTLYPKPTWAEQDPESWWKATETTIKESIKRAKIRGAEIEGICISGLAPECAPIDKKGKPLRNAILWMDRRATEECRWIEEQIGLDRVNAICGNTLDPYFGGPKWLWFKNHEPDLYQKTWKILQGHSYSIFKLTGEIVTDYSHGGLCSPNFDLVKKRWSEEICETMGISVDKLPELHPSHKVIGEITSEASSKTLLEKGTPVVTGGGDFACSTLGCGVISVGEACQMLGTAGNILIPLGKTIKPDPRLINTVHVTGEYLTLGSIFAGGLVRWFRDHLASPEIDIAKEKGVSPYVLLDEQAEKVPPGSEGLIALPYFMGERTPIWDAYARGLFLGLTPYHTRIHMYRAILEGIAYAFRHMLEIAEMMGVYIEKIVSVNGGAKSGLWRQIFADVLGVSILYISASGGAPMGDAVLAGVGTGYFKDFSVVKEWLEVTEKNETNRKVHETYLEYYKIYKRIYEHLKQDFRDLYRISSIANK
jgi:xylulokinase